MERIPVVQIEPVEIQAWSERMSEGERKIFVIDWSILKRCNYDCDYCFHDAHDTFSDVPTIDILMPRAEKIIDFISKLPEDYEVFINITGGEPFLVKDLDVLVEFLNIPRKHKMRVFGLSNGSFVPSKYEKTLRGYTYFLISWHVYESDAEKTKRTILGVKEIMGNNFRVQVLCDPRHEDLVSEAMDFCIENDIMVNAKTIFSSTIPVRMSDEFNRKYAHCVERIGQYKDLVIKYSDGMTRRANSDQTVQTCQNAFKNWECEMGKRSLRINPNGDVFRSACQFGGSLGHIDDLEEITYETQTLRCPAETCVCPSDLLGAAYIRKVDD